MAHTNIAYRKTKFTQRTCKLDILWLIINGNTINLGQLFTLWSEPASWLRAFFGLRRIKQKKHTYLEEGFFRSKNISKSEKNLCLTPYDGHMTRLKNVHTYQ